MKHSFIILLGILSCALRAQELDTVRSIVLNDQFNRTHTLSFPTNKPVFVAIADRDAAEPMKHWIEASKQQFGTNVYYTGVADVRKVPAVLGSFIRKKFKEAYTHPILLDWSGSLAGPLKAKTGMPNVYLLSPDGKVLATESGAVTETKMQHLLSAMGRFKNAQ